MTRRFLNAFLIVAALITLLGAAWLRFSTVEPNATPGTLELTFLPSSYCPQIAQLVVAKTVGSENSVVKDASVPIVSCRLIELKDLALSSGLHQLYVKLPMAIAFRTALADPEFGAKYSPVLGDVNNDNSIDSADEQLVLNSIFKPDKAYDIDGDGAVNVIDASFVRLNQRLGVNRPDETNWDPFEDQP